MTANIQVVLLTQANCNFEGVVANLDLLNLTKNMVDFLNLKVYFIGLVFKELDANFVCNDRGTDKIVALN